MKRIISTLALLVACSASQKAPVQYKPPKFELPEMPFSADESPQCKPTKTHEQKGYGQKGYEIIKFNEGDPSCRKFRIGEMFEVLPDNKQSHVSYVLHRDSGKIYATVEMPLSGKTTTVIQCTYNSGFDCEKWMEVDRKDMNTTINDTFRYGVRQAHFGDKKNSWVHETPCGIDVDKIPSQHREMVTRKCTQQRDEENRATELVETGYQRLQSLENKIGSNLLL